MQRRNRISLATAIIVQIVFVSAFAAAWLILPARQQHMLQAELSGKLPLSDVQLTARTPVTVDPFYDDPQVVSDEELAGVLHKVLPRFSRVRLRPNYVEHAIRVWGSQIEFDNPDLISGSQMRDYLLDTGQYVDSWGTDFDPILEPNDDGIHVRWGPDASASVHHDHMLASLAEAGVTLDTPVSTPGRLMTMEQVMSEALRDFRLDEKETEWSVMAFGSYLPQQDTGRWHNSQGREISFDMLAGRLMRNHKRHGVCLGTHRVYSLMLLLRLDDEHGGEIVSDDTRERIMSYLSHVRELIIASQYPDGSWPPNWWEGEDAMANEDPQEKIYRRVIATGHHLEWLAIAPEELHPPREDIKRAADWIISNTLETPQETIDNNYTYYSHVGSALSLWRKTSAAEFWTRWRQSNPQAESFPEAENSGETSSSQE